MEVYSCGIIVKSKILQRNAIITAFEVRFGSVVYELSYQHEGEVKKIWANEQEFEAEESKQLNIGFKNGN